MSRSTIKSTDSPPINDGGERMSYGDGKAIREPSTGKGRFDLITPFGLMRLAKWYEVGAKKYSDIGRLSKEKRSADSWLAILASF